MKKTLLALTAILLLASCGKNEEKAPEGTNVHISGNVKGFKKGRLFLTRLQDTTAVILDTINIDGNSAFETHIKLDSPEMLYLVIDRVSSNSMDDNLPIFAEAGNIKIDTKLDAFYYGAKITGSENQKLYEEFLSQKKRLTDANLELEKKGLEAQMSKNQVRMDSVQKARERNEVRIYLATANFAITHAGHDVAAYLAVHDIPNINIKYLLMINEKLSAKVKKSLYGTQLAQLIAYKKVNDPAPAAPVAPVAAK